MKPCAAPRRPEAVRVGMTGARGTLGRRVVAELHERGHEVDAFSGDVTDRAAVHGWASGQQTVVHSAAVVPVGAVEDDTARAVAVNVGGTINVARALAERGARLLHISTSHVYRPSDEPLAETGELDPASDYGVTKLQAEHWVGRILSNAAILRLFSFFDARQAESYVVPALAGRMEQAELGADIALHGARSVRDFVDAVWFAGRVVDAVERDVAGPINLCTGHGTSIAVLARTLADALGRGDTNLVPQAGEANRLVGDPSRAVELLGNPAAFDLDAALVRFVAERAS